MIDISCDIRSSFKKKVNHQSLKRAEEIMIRNTTLEAEKRCKTTAPYKTGNLKRSHSTHISPQEGQVKNNANYAKYVIYGTSKMKARNYPKKVVGSLSSQKYMTRTFLTELRRMGMIE